MRVAPARAGRGLRHARPHGRARCRGRALSRTSVAIAALMIAVSVTIGVGDHGRQLPPDGDPVARSDPARRRLCLGARAWRAIAPTRDARPELVAAARSDARAWRARHVPRCHGRAAPRAGAAGGARGPAARGTPRYRFREGDPDGDLAAPCEAATALIVSEPLAYRHELHPGDTVTLLTDRATRAFPVAGVYLRLRLRQGVVLHDWRDLPADTGTTARSRRRLYAAPGRGSRRAGARLRAPAAPTR